MAAADEHPGNAMECDPGDSIECGYCLQQNDQLVDPRKLPCSHIYCYPCLVGDFETSRIVKCGKCRKVFDVTLAKLPFATEGKYNFVFCDVCMVQGTSNELAVSYCKDCNKKMCAQHIEVHQDFQPEHKELMNIDEYKHNVRKLEVKNCTEHVDKPIISGCAVCCVALCISCMTGAKNCVDENLVKPKVRRLSPTLMRRTYDANPDGVAHQVVSLDQLVKLLKTRKDNLVSHVHIKEEKLWSLLKYSTKVLSDYEKKTAEMIEQIRTTRDEHPEGSRGEFGALEKEVMEKMNASKNRIEEYMEQGLGGLLTEINTMLMLQDIRFRDAHQVDIVRNYTSTSNEIIKLSRARLPALKLEEEVRLAIHAEHGEMTLEFVEDTALHINDSCLVRRISLPTAIEQVGEVKNTRNCWALFSYSGVTYISHITGITAINEHDYTMEQFAEPGGDVSSICVYDNKMYVAVSTPFQKVFVLDMFGKTITHWDHIESAYGMNKLTVTDDKVIVPDKGQNRFIIYSLTGQIIKYIYSRHVHRDMMVCLCSPEPGSIVVATSNATSVVFKVNIETEEEVWSYNKIKSPGGVTCLGEDYILVAPFDSSEAVKPVVYILDSKTGKLLGKLEDDRLSSSGQHDLHAVGNTLIVPQRNGSVLYYKLIADRE